MSASAAARRLGATILVGTLGGGLATLVGLPVGWLLGSAIAVSLASILGLRVGLPNRLRDVVFVVLGIQAGSGVTPEVVSQIAVWPLSFLIQMVGVVLVVVATSAFLRIMFGWDRETALFASIPGAMSFVLAAATDTRADMTRVVVMQSLRLILLMGVLVPFIAWLEGGQGGTVATLTRGRIDGTPLQYLALAGSSTALAVLGVALRVPGGLILGALIGSAVMHGTGLAPVSVPIWISTPALVLLGGVIGARLRREDRHAMLQILPASLGAFVIGLAMSALAGLVAFAILRFPFAQITLAYAPGALEALTVLAFQFDLDPAYVAGHHVVRFICLALAVPLLVKRMPRRRSDAASEADARDTAGTDDRTP